MQRPPTPEEVRELIDPLDERDRKVLAGLVALMVHDPSKIRDQEWVAERFVQVAVVAHGFDADETHATTDDVDAIEDYAKQRMGPIVQAALALFVRTAEELRARAGGFTIDDVHAIVRSHLESR